MRRMSLAGCVVACLSAGAGMAGAGVIGSTGYQGLDNQSVNLTTEGTSDWAAWFPTNSTYSPNWSRFFMQHKSGGSGAIGAIQFTPTVSAANSRTLLLKENWSDGVTGAGDTTPSTSSVVNFNLVSRIEPNADHAAGDAQGFSVTLHAGQSGTLNVYLTRCNSNLVFDASIDDGLTTAYTDTIAYSQDWTSHAGRYAVNFTATAESHLVVTVRSTDANQYNGVGIAAASLVVPEPATLSVIGMAVMGIAARRRRVA